MAVADRTFSFRAPTELRERLDHVQASYSALSRDAGMAAHITRELEIRLQRRLREPSAHSGQGGILRAVVEAFVEATETAEHDARLADDLRAFDRADEIGAAERRALLERSAAAGDA